LGAIKIELKNAQFEVQEIRSQRDDLVSQHEQNVEKTQALEKNLEDAQAELNKTQSQVQNLQAQRDDAKREQSRQFEQQLHQIRELEKGLATTKVELDNAQVQKQELQEKHIEQLAQKDKEYGDKAKQLEEQCSQVKDLTERHVHCKKHTQELGEQLAFIANPSAAAEADSEDVTITDTSASPDIGNAKADRLKIDASLKWSGRSRRDDWKWCVRAGIVQQGPYPDRQLIQLKLPQADSFYSDLPAPIPKPCSDSDVDDKKSCGHCHEAYLKNPSRITGLFACCSSATTPSSANTVRNCLSKTSPSGTTSLTVINTIHPAPLPKSWHILPL
jgi:hypothetical protein